MNHASLDAFVKSDLMGKGPVAVILAEDQVEVETTLQHHLGLGFAQVILLCDPDIVITEASASRIHRVTYDTHADNALIVAVNRLIVAAPGLWMYYCYNAEYLF